MSYLGRGVDKISNIEKLDNITFDGSSSYTLQKGSVNFVPSSAEAILISIDGIVQSGNFTVSASTIDFGTAVAGTSTCNFVIHLGTGLLTTPSDGSVSAAKLASSSVTRDKLNLISDASNPSLIAKGTSGVSEGYIQLNCAENSHGIKLKSPPHSAGASYTLTFPNNDGDANQFLKTDGSGNLSFAAAGLDGWSSNSGNLLPADASKGIYLGVNSATASNLLDDYEEGTWTGTVASGTFSYTHNTGYYRKVGNLVYIQIYLVISGYTSGNRVGLDGLPFTSKNISSYDGHYPISCTRFSNTHESVLAVYPMINPGSTQLKTDTMNSAGNTITSNNVEFFGASTQVRFAGCYLTD